MTTEIETWAGVENCGHLIAQLGMAIALYASEQDEQAVTHDLVPLTILTGDISRFIARRRGGAAAAIERFTKAEEEGR